MLSHSEGSLGLAGGAGLLTNASVGRRRGDILGFECSAAKARSRLTAFTAVGPAGDAYILAGSAVGLDAGVHSVQ